MSASDLATTIAEHTKEANEEEKKLGEGTFRTLRVRIGEALQERNLKDPSGKWQVDLARDWDLNRDGSITKMEFRQDVRNTVSNAEGEITVQMMDGLFEEMDLNHSGELDMKEVMLALKGLQVDAAKAAKKREAVRERVKILRQRVQAAQEVFDVTKVYEDSHKAMIEEERGSVASQMGAILKGKNLKVSEVVSKWGGERGALSRSQFRTNALALGVDAPNSAIDSLFDNIDTDRNGSLSVTELQAGLKMILDDRSPIKTAMKDLKADVMAKEKIARAAQEEYRQQRAAADAEAEEAAAKKAAAEAAAAEAAEQLKASRKAALAEKQKQKEAEEAAFNARIAAKRNGAK